MLKSTLLRSTICGAVLFSLIFFSLAPNALANDWVTYQKDSTHNGIVPEDSVLGNLELQWSKKTSFQHYLTPVYQDGIFYFLEYSNTNIWSASAMDKSSGRELWRTNGQGVIRSDMTVADGYLLIPSNTLTALDTSTGAKRWETDGLANYLFYNPIISSGNIYVFERYSSGGTSTYLTSLKLDDGSLLWRKPLYAYGVAGLSIYKDSVIATTADPQNDTNIYSYNQSDGALNWTYERTYNPSGPMVIDESRGFGFITSAVGVITQLNLDSVTQTGGISGGGSPTSPLLIDGKACFITSSLSWFAPSSDLGCLDYVQNSKTTKRIESGIRLTGSNPILVGDRIYMTASTGKLVSFKLDASDYKTTAVTTEPLGPMIYADGVFLILNTTRDTFYAMSSEPLRIVANSNVSLISPYKTDGDYHEYLGQTHCHYVPDAASWQEIFKAEPILPSYTENLYKNAGYDFVALTEHDEIVHDPGVSGILHIADSEEDTHSLNKNHILAIGITSPINEFQTEQKRINDIADQGGVALLSHPNSNLYPWSFYDLVGNIDYTGIEIFNGSGYYLRNFKPLWGNYEATDKWDKLLTAGIKMTGKWGSAGDDYTPGDGGFDNAAIVVLSKSLDQTEILQNIKSGNFYAAQGSKAPRIKVTITGPSMTVTSNAQGNIKFIGKDGKTLKEESGVLASTYIAKGDEIYIRAEVEANGKKSWSQPVNIDPNQNAANASPGWYRFDLGQTQLYSHNTGGVQVSTLPLGQFPDQSPPYGYISPIYNLTSDGQVLNGTELTISYADRDLLTNEDNLSIYTYDQPTSTWSKVNSTIDKLTKTVTASLPHFSLYTLSAEMPVDTERPTVSLIEPANLTDLEGNITFNINAMDNEAVFKITTLIDDKLVNSDAVQTDGWKTIADMNDHPAGSHKLTLVAEDAAGNTGEANYGFTIKSSAFVPPQITVSDPSENEYLSGTSDITGTFTSPVPVDSIGIFLDDVFIDNADITGTNYQKQVDWTQFVDGNHTLKIILTDQRGNQATTEKAITLGVKAEIASPFEKTYLHADETPVEFTSQPEGMIAKIDGAAIANHSSIDAYALSLGQHIFTVEYDSKIIAQKTFTISTTIADQINLVNKFWQEGRFKNQGMRDSITEKLTAAQISQSLGLIGQRNLILNNLISFIAQKNDVKKPLIDSLATGILRGDLGYLVSQR